MFAYIWANISNLYLNLVYSFIHWGVRNLRRWTGAIFIWSSRAANSTQVKHLTNHSSGWLCRRLFSTLENFLCFGFTTGSLLCLHKSQVFIYFQLKQVQVLISIQSRWSNIFKTIWFLASSIPLASILSVGLLPELFLRDLASILFKIGWKISQSIAALRHSN